MNIQKAKALHLEASVNRTREMEAAGRPAKLLPPILVGVIAFAAGVGLFLFLENGDAGVNSEVAPLARSMEPTPATNREATLAPTVGASLTAAGYVEPVPPYPVQITPLIPGRIDSFPLAEGDPVVKGEIIARLNTEVLERQAQELRASRNVTLQRLATARRELARSELLRERGSATGKEYDDALSDVQVLLAETEKLSAELETVEWKIEQSTVRSPVDGVLFERMAREGEFINLDERHAIATVVNPEQMQVWADINQRDLARLRVGAPAVVRLDAEPDRAFSATVDRILPRASLARNTVRCILRLEEFSPALRPDMSVQIAFLEP